MASEIIPLGDAALMVQVGDSLGEVLAITRQLERARIPGAIEIVSAFASVAVFLQSPNELENARRAVALALTHPEPPRDEVASATLEIPICYDEEFALDVARISEHCQLSPTEIARAHAAGDYHVRCVGFTPGFPFLSGLPDELATPRRPTPRPAIAAGSVAIGGKQSGIYSVVSPGGWNIIGRTPLQLFDAARAPAALLQVGNRVRFRAITREQFDRWEK